MQDLRPRIARLAAIAAVGIAAIVAAVPSAAAQNPKVEEKVAALKQSIAANKQAIAQYGWQEVETISVKGEVKDTKTYQVQMGPNGQPQKTEVGNEPAQQGGREGRLKKRVVTHVTDEYQQYGQQIAALAKQYNPPSPQKLEAAYKQGNVSLDLGGGAGTVSLVIKNYVKPNDSMTLVFNEAGKAIESVRVATYLSDPSDVVTIAAQFAKIPGGPNHVASTLVNGVSKQLTVATQNSNYQHK
jgi:predicted regulator of Ras-like GTPase activity (Roadblock/LC7/MglB family)